MNAIGAMRRVIMIMEPWYNPIPLTRAWCLWEVFCTVSTGASFEIAMCKEETERFREMILNDYTSFFDMLGNIDVRNSESFLVDDRKQIFAVIEKRIGFGKLNSLAIRCLQKWVVSEVEKMENAAQLNWNTASDVNSVNLSSKNVGFEIVLGSGSSNAFYVQYLQRKKTLVILKSITDPFPLRTAEMTGYQDLMKVVKFSATSNLVNLEYCLAIAGCRVRLLQTEKDRGMGIPENVFLKGREFYDSVLQILLDNPEGTTSRNFQHKTVFENGFKEFSLEESTQRKKLYLSALLSNAQFITLCNVHEEENVQVVADCYEFHREFYGESHKQTLQALYTLAKQYEFMGFFEEALTYFQRCFECQQQIYGKYHPTTLQTMSDIADLYSTLDCFSKSRPYFRECLAFAVEKLGEQSQFSKVISKKTQDLEYRFLHFSTIGRRLLDLSVSSVGEFAFPLIHSYPSRSILIVKCIYVLLSVILCCLISVFVLPCLFLLGIMHWFSVGFPTFIRVIFLSFLPIKTRYYIYRRLGVSKNSVNSSQDFFSNLSYAVLLGIMIFSYFFTLLFLLYIFSISVGKLTR
jgi:tetratricopeptide (TPR) repeat protein